MRHNDAIICILEISVPCLPSTDVLSESRWLTSEKGLLQVVSTVKLALYSEKVDVPNDDWLFTLISPHYSNEWWRD